MHTRVVFESSFPLSELWRGVPLWLWGRAVGFLEVASQISDGIWKVKLGPWLLHQGWSLYTSKENSSYFFFPNDCTLGSLASCVLEMENSWNIPIGWGSRWAKLCNHVLRLGLRWSCLIPILAIARHPQMIIFNEMSLLPLTVLFKSASTILIA